MDRRDGHTSATVALQAVERLARPSDLDGAVEVVVASPANRSFPDRLLQSLGVCLKIGPRHAVRADGQSVDYPADSVCVRPPGCVWGVAATGPVGFVSVDIGVDLLPEFHGGQMAFVHSRDIDVRRLAKLLLSRAPRLQKHQAIAQLVADLSDRGVLPARIPLDTHPSWPALERARSFLQESLDWNPSLDMLAAEAGLNKHVLVRQFRRRYGTTPHAYLLLVKVDRAQAMLAGGAAAVEVATTLGFADQAHLTRTFKKVVGLTPAAYRDRVRLVA